MNESEQSYLRSFSGTAAGGGPMAAAALLSTSPPSMLANMPVYASNLDQHIDRALLTGNRIFLTLNKNMAILIYKGFCHEQNIMIRNFAYISAKILDLLCLHIIYRASLC